MDRINKIKNGDLNERNQFIQDYVPFIVKNVSSYLNKYIESENSDEYMVGLEAFNEAIEKFDCSRGNFLSFAALVIKSRIIDYKRKENVNVTIMSIDCFDENEYPYPTTELENPNIDHGIDLQLELEEFKKKLKEFKISFNDLVDKCPKHHNTRSNALMAARYIYEHEKEMKYLYLKKRIPYITLVSELGLSKKFLDRFKEFIISSALILDSDLDLIKTYIYDIERRSEGDLYRTNNRYD